MLCARSPESVAGFALAQALDTSSLLSRDNALCIRDSYTVRQESHANGGAVGDKCAGKDNERGGSCEAGKVFGVNSRKR